MFDLCVTDKSCHSNQNTDPLVMLKRHEKEKKEIHRNICLKSHMDFCLLIYSVDGIPGRDTRAAENQLITILSHE